MILLSDVIDFLSVQTLLNNVGDNDGFVSRYLLILISSVTKMHVYKLEKSREYVFFKVCNI